jgi:hypothetical protein
MTVDEGTSAAWRLINLVGLNRRSVLAPRPYGECKLCNSATKRNKVASHLRGRSATIRASTATREALPEHGLF